MKELYALLPKARAALPLRRLLEQHGGFCPWCQQQAAYATASREQRGLILPESIEQVKQATDITRTIGERVKLARSGAAFVGLCPFHQEKSPSFNVVPNKQMFHCFGCQKSGSVIDFVAAIDGLEFVAAVKRLAQTTGVTLRFEHEEERWYFNCQTAHCPSKSLAKAAKLDELDFLEKHLNLKPREALTTYLRGAGVVHEGRLSPSVLPGQQRRKSSLGKISNPPAPPAVETVPATITGSNEGKASEMPAEAGGTPAPEQPMSKSGDVGVASTPCTAKKADGTCGATAVWRHPQFAAGAFCEVCKTAAERFLPNNWVVLSEEEEVPLLQITNADELVGAQLAVKRLRAKIGTAKAFNRPTTKYDGLLADAETAVARYEAGLAAAEAARTGAARAARDVGFAALEYFYRQLLWRVQDDNQTFLMRGLTTATCAALGFRSNPPTNREILLAMANLFDWDELFASGLWREEEPAKKKERRPNSQFCGSGRIRKVKDGERAKRGEWVDDDDWLWGECSPVLIPYRDAHGRLIGLRPHKGMGRGGTVTGTPHVYVPRPGGKVIEEKFATVVICEGEFKAAALWQQAHGRFGVCALPGINFGKHFEVREELDEWLRSVGCRCVKVAFDNEDKSDKEMRKRHDARRWAGFLATQLSQRLHISGEVVVLPSEWRVDGKADWDGALAQQIHGNKPT